MLERENEFYMAHQAEFHEKYNDKWLVIAGDKLWGVYDKISDAAKEALEHFKSEEILIHRPSDDNTVIEIGPIISFAQTNDNLDVEIKTKISEGNPVAFSYVC